MRTVPALFVLVLLGGCGDSPFASNARYSIVAASRQTLLLDSQTGNTWALTEPSSGMGGPRWIEMQRGKPPVIHPVLGVTIKRIS